MPKIAVVIFALLLCPSVFSQEPMQTQEDLSASGDAFLRQCSAIDSDNRTSMDVLHAMACMGYVTGVVDGVLAETAFVRVATNTEPPKPFCLPEQKNESGQSVMSVENGQLVRVVLKYIPNHPEAAHDDTASLIALSLREAFPCKP